MSKEQLEKDLCQNGFCSTERRAHCRLSANSYCWDVEIIAEKLYNADYRKQSEGKWLFKPTVSRTPSAINYTCSLCGFESARTTPFCPECGAKMKGESNEQGAD